MRRYQSHVWVWSLFGAGATNGLVQFIIKDLNQTANLALPQVQKHILQHLTPTSHYPTPRKSFV